jgi:hypothetical protein
MGLQLAIAQIYIPGSIRKRKLQELFQATARAFQYSAPLIDGLTFQDSLKQYAIFTRDRAEETIQQGRENKVKNQLFQNAFEIGMKLKEDFRIEGTREVMRMSQIVYKILGIEFRGNSRGEVLIRQCLFSSFYSGKVCRLISSLDSGLLAGLSNGSKLEFSQRITEGNSCCRAKLSLQRNSP